MPLRFASIALIATATLATASSHAALTSYSQDFEGLDRTQATALGADGWKIFMNAFIGTSTTVDYGYGVFDAPNDIVAPNISVISENVGGEPPVGTQGLVVFSDYNNAGEHSNGDNIEVNFFQEQTISALDVGQTYRFSFVSNKGDIGGNATAAAFIKTLDPNQGFAQTNIFTVDTGALPDGNFTNSIDITIDPALDGQLLQFGFSNLATDFDPSGVNYDNVSFGLIPEPASAVLGGIGSMLLLRRRRTA